MTFTFPDDFQWGSGASAYQVEGAWDADGKVPSIWDTYQHGSLRTPDGTSGDTAIDQYHRLDEDLDLLQRLGAPAHRCSVSWPRIVTDAAGTVNSAGLAYYDRVVDGMLQRGLVPVLNLFHWDTPQWMEDLGGMMNRDFAERFADFAGAVAARLGDRVAQWYTMNEPGNPALGGYVAGFLPPHRAEGVAGMAAVHHLQLAHGRAIQALRAAGVTGQVGTILSLGGVAPATSHPDDVRAAERAEYFEGRLFLDPLLGRGHLPEFARVLGDVLRDGDEAIIAQPMDLLGVNWYSQYRAASPDRADVHFINVPSRGAMFAGLAPLTAPLGFAIVPAPGIAWGGAHRQLTPGGLRDALDWVARTYPDHPDIIITENGVGYADPADEHGFVQDDERIDYLNWALAELGQAMADGARVRGYHVWSSFDNFQWMSGFSQRFGLIHVDPHTFVRTPKASFEWYRETVRTGQVQPVAAEVRAGDHLGVEIEGVRNARGVGGLRTVDGGILRDGMLLRSAMLQRMTDDGSAALEHLGVRTILDLRGEEEVRRAPDEVPFARVVHLPLHDPAEPGVGGILGAAADALHQLSMRDMYAGIIRDRGPQIVAGVREVAASDSPVLVHCTAGKDRTGVFVALLLSAIGVCDEDVIESYAQSQERLGQAFLDEVRQAVAFLLPEGAEMPPALIEIATASPAEWIRHALDVVRHDHGTAAAYLLSHGLRPEELARLRERFVE